MHFVYRIQYYAYYQYLLALKTPDHMHLHLLMVLHHLWYQMIFSNNHHHHHHPNHHRVHRNDVDVVHVHNKLPKKKLNLLIETIV